MDEDDPVEVLRRWEDFGAVWEVVHRTGDQITVSLCRCDGGEEMSRIVSGDPRLLAYVDGRDQEDGAGGVRRE